MNKQLQIRNSTVYFLMFTRDAKDDGIKVRVQDNYVRLTWMAISKLFDVDRSVVTKHLKSVFESGELSEIQYVQILHKLLMETDWSNQT